MSLIISLRKPALWHPLLAGLVASGVFFFTGQFAGAQPFLLTSPSGNSSILVHTAQRALIDTWNVDGVDHLEEKSDWYRIGGAPGGNIAETSVHTLQLVSAMQTGGNTATVIYRHAQFDIRFDYAITGGPVNSGVSSMGETVFITNTQPIGTPPLQFHFFEYVDFDLTNTAGDDIGRPVNPSRVDQRDGQTIVTTGAVLGYDLHEFSFFPTTLNHLGNTGLGSTSTLNNSPPFGTDFGPGDVTFALQFDFVTGNPLRPAIPAQQTAIIEKNFVCMPIPEPTGSLACAGWFVSALARRRRARR